MKFEWVLGTSLPQEFLKVVDSWKPGTVVFLEGPMGAGKTTLVRLLCERWGIQDVSSPTYAFHYRTQGGGRIIDHWDLYRIQSEEELESTGFWDQVPSADSIVFVEWPNKARGFSSPNPFFRIQIESGGQNRKVEVRSQ